MLDSSRTLVPARTSADLWASWGVTVGLVAAVGIAYFLAARLSLALLTTPDGVAVFWPAAGFAAGTIIALGSTAQLPVALGVIAATIMANLTGDRNLPAAIVFALCNAGEALLIAWLLERHLGSGFRLDSLRRVLGLFLAAGIASVVSGMGGTAGFALFHSSEAPVLITWLNWFASDAIGVVTVAPLVIGLVRSLRDVPAIPELVEGVFMLVVLALASAIGFGWRDNWLTILPLAVLLPLLIWPAARCPPVFAAAAVFILSLVVVSTLTFSIGLLGDPSIPLSDRVLAAQATLLSTSLCALVLAALFDEKRSREALLSDSNEQLRTQEESFRRLLGALPAAIYTTDRAGYITYCNQAAVDLWGRRPELGKDQWSEICRLHYPDGTPMPLDDRPTQMCLKQGRAFRGREALLERTDGTRVPVIPCPAPLIDEQGTVVGIVNMKLDITKLKQTELALSERNTQLELVGRAALVGSFTFDCITGITQLAPGCVAIYGLPEGNVELSRAEGRACVHPEDLPRLDAQFNQACKEQQHELVAQFRIIRANDGAVRWIETRSLISYQADQPLRMIGIGIDVTERKQAEDNKSLLIAELDHRVKNMLACVAAVAQRTRECSTSMEEFLERLEGRIHSLANTHALLSHRGWQGVNLVELVRAELAPCMKDGNSFIEGPGIDLSAEATQVVAMVLHELATNAMKYGALSMNRGRVSVSWKWQSNGSPRGGIVFEWREAGGPPVRPRAPGYGTSVIRDLIPYELSGTVDHALASDGVCCRMEIPGRWLNDSTPLRGTFKGAGKQLHAAS